MLKINIFPCLGRSAERLPDEISVVGMNSLECELQGGLNGLIVLKDLVAFLRPVDFSTRNVPAEAASLAQALRLCQVCLALAERLFGPLTFGLLCGFTQRALNRRHKPR